jgi:sulfatase maturation enzyme AslB (radical SAM superfamily)
LTILTTLLAESLVQKKNNAIIIHQEFLSSHTRIKMHRFTTIGSKFVMTEEEGKSLNLHFTVNKRNKTTLRRVLQSWYEGGTKLRIIQAIETCSVNTQTILLEARHQEEVTQKLNVSLMSSKREMILMIHVEIILNLVQKWIYLQSQEVVKTRLHS